MYAPPVAVLIATPRPTQTLAQQVAFLLLDHGGNNALHVLVSPIRVYSV